MSYIPLARQYRPQTFSAIVGQTDVSETLKKEVTDNKVVSGYLFCGPRGTAKTSTARILAKAMNCIGPDGNRTEPNPDPCNVCESCTQISESHHIDVLEIDAASHGSIDNIRDIIASIAYPPIDGRYKIYIIDEAHQLSKDAKDALLKTLEEPPPYVIFILATTEMAKIPPTIASRCQVFQFKPGSQSQIILNLEKILKEEHRTLDPESLELIAHQAQGSYRDSLSILDRLLATYENNIGIEDTLKVISIPDNDLLDEVIAAIQSQDRDKAFSLSYKITQQGISGYGFAQQLGERIRDLMLYQISPKKNTDPKIIDQAKLFTYTQLSRLSSVYYFLKDRLITGGYELVELQLCILKLIDSLENEPISILQKPTKLVETEKIEEELKEVKIEPGEVKTISDAINYIMAISFDYPDYFTPSAAAKTIAEYVEKTEADLPTVSTKTWFRGLRLHALGTVRRLCNNCTKCELSKNRLPDRGSVFGEGTVDPAVLLVAEGPGEFEQRTGLPLVSQDVLQASTCTTECDNFEACYTIDGYSDGPWAYTPNKPCKYTKTEVTDEMLLERMSERKKELHTSGVILNDALIKAGLQRSSTALLLHRLNKLGEDIKLSDIQKPDVFITNAVRCRCVNDSGQNAEPSVENINACRPWLHITERLILAKSVVGLGKIGLISLNVVNDDKLIETGEKFAITKICASGQPTNWARRSSGGTAAVCLHPSYIMRKNDSEIPALTDKMVEILKEAKNA